MNVNFIPKSLLLNIFILTVCLLASPNARSEADDYQAIQQILKQHCISCHGPMKKEGGLRLDRGTSILQGGDSGPALTRRSSQASELIRRVTSSDEDRMPPEGAQLSAEEIQKLTQWIDADLPGLPTDEEADEDIRLKHWAWQPIRRPTLPEITEQPQALDKFTAYNAIDQFIIAKLQERNLPQSPLAPLRERLRRLTFDLHGLPNTLTETQDLADQSDSADLYEKTVDRYLANPAYGEKWARHWLDIAHYADTHGFERDQRRPNAWRYRDYVIDSWNRDLPYDQFVQQQIAGDIIAPREPDSVIATGFLAAGPYDFVGQEETQSEVLRRQARADDLDDMITQVMTSLCGVTLHCARCHEHKLDPISQTEYYEMVALFSAVRRTDRPVDYQQLKEYEEKQTELSQNLAALRSELKKIRNQGLDLADVVGGGNGFGTGKLGSGLDPVSGNVQIEKRGFLDGIKLNQFCALQRLGIDGIAIPDGLIDGVEQRLKITSTGIEIAVPDTSGAGWDAVRNGPVNSQHSTVLDGVDYGTEHAMLGLHANVAITFDLDHFRKATQKELTHFRSGIGYFGQTEKEGASIYILLDGNEAVKYERLGRTDGLKSIDLPLTPKHRFLTLLITDAGNGIGHDQVCFIDPVLTSRDFQDNDQLALHREKEIQRLETELTTLQTTKDQLAIPQRYFGIQNMAETPIFRLRRGNPEDPLEPAHPNAIRCLSVPLELKSGATTDEERRYAFANWLVNPQHPLLARVIVNRLWHYHFGRGLVDTPSDFGLGGSLPTHPELLDWLASELIDHDWSIKHIQRLICTSYTYQQSSIRNEAAIAKDVQNQYLWRRSPKRLDAEALRDAVLSASGCIDRRFHGPGYEDFEYQEEYAPVYRYIPANAPALWRRSIYRYIVRTTTHQFLATLDCPNAANLTPVRDHTTTALQALALLNNDFMRDQAHRFAARLQNECGDNLEAKIERAFLLTFARTPSEREMKASLEVIKQSSVAVFCLTLFNANEFVFVD